MKITQEALDAGFKKIQASQKEGKNLSVHRWPETFGFTGDVEAALIYVEGPMTPELLQSVERVAIQHKALESAREGID